MVVGIIHRYEGLIANWRALLDHLDDRESDEGLAEALSAADAGLDPLRKIAALPVETQTQVLAHLDSKGVTVDKLYDVGLSDAALACAARLKLCRERRLLQRPFAELIEGAVLMNALGEVFDARTVLAGKLPLLLFASHASEVCVAAVPMLRELHGLLRAAAGFEAQIVHVSCGDEAQDEARLLRFMRSPAPDAKARGPLPWLAVPPGSALHSRLRGRFDSAMSGPVSLLLLSSLGSLLSRTAACDVRQEGAAAVIAKWGDLVRANAPLEPVDLGYDAFADPASLLAAARAAAGEGFDGVRVSTSLTSCACGRVLLELRTIGASVVIVGANWSRECALVEEALALRHMNADGAAGLVRSYTFVRLNYETSQAHLLKAFGPAMHHKQVPTIAVLVKGVVVGRTSVRELLCAEGDEEEAGAEAAVCPDASKLADALLAWLEGCAAGYINAEKAAAFNSRIGASDREPTFTARGGT